MGTVFLCLFMLLEITLVVLTITKFKEKTAWLRNRALIRLAELVLLTGIICVPTINFKWRFFAALFVLIVRCLISGISWIVKHKKIEGIRTKGRTVLNCIISIILIATALVPSFLFTNYNGLETTGDFKVNETEAILVDESRQDTFENDGSFREVPAHFYYPEGKGFGYPLLIFSHGAFGYYQSNYSTYMEMASNGYVVVALDHPHHAFFTQDTDGKIITVDSDFMDDAMNIGNGDSVSNEEVFKVTQEWLELRKDDENFVLDTIISAKSSKQLNKVWHTENKAEILNVLSQVDTDKIGLMGHSLGGATSVALGRERKDIDAIIDIDGTTLGEVTKIKNNKCVSIRDPYPIPLLVMSQEINEEDRGKGAYSGVNEYLIDNAKDAKYVELKGAKHMDFTDLPLISPFLGDMLGHGDIDSEKCMIKVNSLVLNWFDYYLKGKGIRP